MCLPFYKMLSAGVKGSGAKISASGGGPFLTQLQSLRFCLLWGHQDIYLMMFLIHSHFSYQKKPWFSTLITVLCITFAHNPFAPLGPWKPFTVHLTLQRSSWSRPDPPRGLPVRGRVQGPRVGDSTGEDEEWGTEAGEWAWGSSVSNFTKDVCLKGSLLYMTFV